MNPAALRGIARCVGGLALGSALAGAGCASSPEEPFLEMSLADLRFTRATVFETVAQVQVRFENISPEDLQITGAAHRLSVNGASLGRALASDTVPVPRLQGATQAAELHLRHLALARTLHEISQSGLVTYELDSTVYVRRAGRGERAVRLRKTGELDLDRLAPAPGADR